MSATKNDIRRWLQSAALQKATHLIVVCDTFNWEDFAVFVKPDQSVRKVHDDNHGKDMKKVIEVYALHLDWEAQINEHRSFHFESPP